MSMKVREWGGVRGSKIEKRGCEGGRVCKVLPSNAEDNMMRHLQRHLKNIRDTDKHSDR